jgi:hypothetical protein
MLGFTAGRGIVFGLILVIGGCVSPEDGRVRGGGNGGDGGNYVRNAVHVPSKIDGTKAWPLEKP